MIKEFEREKKLAELAKGINGGHFYTVDNRVNLSSKCNLISNADFRDEKLDTDHQKNIL